MSALLGARLLVLDVIAGHAGLDEPADQVAHVGVAAVAGIGVGDDEGAEVDLRRVPALLLAHAGTRVVLVAVGREERADDRRRLVRHLAERVAGQVRPRVLGARALGAGGPAAQVDGVDPGPLHRHRLSRRVGAEGGDALALGEQPAQVVEERDRRRARDRVVGLDGASLLHDVARRVQPADSPPARAVEPGLQLGNLVRSHRHGVSFYGSQSKSTLAVVRVPSRAKSRR